MTYIVKDFKLFKTKVCSKFMQRILGLYTHRVFAIDHLAMKNLAPRIHTHEDKHML